MFMWSMVYVFYGLCGLWFMWSMVYVFYGFEAITQSI